MIEAALRTILAHPNNPESFAHAKRVLKYHDANPKPNKGETSMSLEAQITELNGNFTKLIALLAGGAVAPLTLQTKVEKAVAEKGITGAKEEVKALVAEAAKEELSYEKHVKTAALVLASKKGKDALIAVLKTFRCIKEVDGVPMEVECSTAKDATPEQFAAMIAAFNAAAGV